MRNCASENPSGLNLCCEMDSGLALRAPRNDKEKWGSQSMTTAIKPFRIAISDEILADLKQRLARTRWPEAELVDDWSQGAPLKWIEEICGHWQSCYDWRAREAKLNRFEQFTTEIDGLDIHFLHVRSKAPNALPLIITHGWPGSI